MGSIPRNSGEGRTPLRGRDRSIGRIVAAWGVLAFATSASAGSAESGRIAYLARGEPDDAYWQVWTRDLSEPSPRQRSRSPGDKTRVSWAPDGHRVLAATLDGAWLWVDEDGAEERVVPEGGPCFGAVLAPAGDAIACSRPDESDPYDHVIWLFAPDGTAPRRLTWQPGMQHQPAWDPTGRWIYFASGEGRDTHDLVRVSRDGRQLEQLSAGPRYRLDPAPGIGGLVAYAWNRSGDYELWIERSPGEPERLTDHAGLDGSPAWSPDGQRLAFERVAGGVPNVWLLALEHPAAKQLTDHPGGARAPAWSAPREVGE